MLNLAVEVEAVRPARRQLAVARAASARTWLPSILAALLTVSGCGDGLLKPELIEASTGFDPAKHGFSFENFAGYVSTAIFDAWSMRRMYGDNVCLQVHGDDCELRPEAQAFADQVNSMTSGGLCEGFAALPALSFTNKIKLKELGVEGDPFLVDREQATLIDREIAYWFGTQLLPAVKKGTQRLTGRQTIEALGKAFKETPNKTFRIGLVLINKAGQAAGGHALMPYATKRISDSNWQILVYDSNHPGVARAIDVDVKKDTWKYLAATNPNEPTGLYTGTGKKNRLYLIDNDLRVGQQPCTFCPGGKGGTQTILSFGSIFSSVKTGSGKSAGNTESGFQDEEEGTSVTPIYGLSGAESLLGDQLPMAIDVPLGEKIEVSIRQVQDKPGKSSANSKVVSVMAIQGEGAFVGMQGANQAKEYKLASSGIGQVTVTSSAPEPVKVRVGLVSAQGKVITIAVQVAAGIGNQNVGLAVSKEDGGTKVDMPNGGTATVSLAVATAEGKSSFIGTIEGGKGDSIAIDVASMKPGQAPSVGLDADGDGKPDNPKPMKACADDPTCSGLKGDHDIVPDDADNCPDQDNPDQANLDKDDAGDACDADADGDGVPKPIDCNDLDSKQNGPCTTSATPVCQEDGDCMATTESCFAAKCMPDGKCAVVPAADGKSCEDGNGCSEGDSCAAGKCAAGKAKNCDDGNPCTAESCLDNQCAVQVVNVACSDGNACTVGDVCAAGTCAPGTQMACSDGNPCTTDACDPAAGCTFTDNTDPCSDNNPCTAKDTCTAGVCKPQSQVPCDDSNPCTTEACDGNGSCKVVNNTEACNDGDVCTAGDLCESGACKPGLKAACFDGNPCSDDACNKDQGCVFLPNAASCSDGNSCTEGDACSAGACASGATIDCNDNEPCTLDGCDIQKGCVHSVSLSACSDGDACTQDDICKAGKCQAGAAVNCSDGNPCTDDACEIAKGCTHANNTGNCDDANACTSGDACGGGLCMPGAVTACDDSNPCTTDSCTPKTGCAAVNNNLPCSDGDACSGFDTCSGGACKPGKQVTCDDGNPCTKDSCDQALGCQNAAATVDCDDGNVCTVADQCSGGVCLPGAATVCDDGNPCTSDGCAGKTGCVFSPNSQQCDDGSACTVGDQCANGQCTAGKQQTCNDSNPCTDDGCDAKAGCIATANSASCSDGDPCSTADSCAQGACKPGSPLNCDDGNPCTQDICGKNLGCQFKPISAPCDDGNVCTVSDQCGGGVCLPGAASVCDDGNACTTDGCSAITGCSTVNNTLPCNDNSVCTVGDLCKNGACAPGKSQVCNDGNVCTDDVCDPLEGCTAVANSAPCDDLNVCTLSEKCVAGSCTIAATQACADDGNLCTDVTCDPKVGCKAVNNTAACDDGKACTSSDKCKDGSCASSPKNCDDSDVCTADSCAEPGGCAHTAVPDFNQELQWGASNVAQSAGMEVDASGNAYFASGSNAASKVRIRKYNPQGAEVFNLNTTSLVVGLERVGTKLFALTEAGQLVELNLTNLGQSLVLASVGTAVPTDLTADKAGNWWVSFDDGKVHKLSAAGNVLTVISACVGAAKGIDFAGDRVFVTCMVEKTVKALTLAGAVAKSVDQLDCLTAGAAYVLGDIEASADGTVYAACGDNLRRFDKDLKVLANLPYAGVLYVAVPPEGKVYAASTAQTMRRYGQDLCDDGSPCSVLDVCAAGTCKGAAKDCDDGNACTNDLCAAQTGSCSHVANTGACEDGVPCTVDTCEGGSCKAGPVCDANATCGGDGQCVCNSGFFGNGAVCLPPW